MVAPKAETLYSMRHRIAGILLYCPECVSVLGSLLRVETPNDYPFGECPDLVGNAGPLGFIARCDHCGFRVEMHGDRLPTVAMLNEAQAHNRESQA